MPARPILSDRTVAQLRTIAARTMQRTLRLSVEDAARLGLPQTEVCSLRPASAQLRRDAGGQIDEAQAGYTLAIPATSPLAAMPPDLVVTIDEEPGRLFRIVSAPAPPDVAAARRFQLDEVR